MHEPALEQAIALIKRGKKETAKRLLQGVINANPYDEIAWLWYIESLTTNDERIQALEWCLRFNPKSEAALKGLQAFKEGRTKWQRNGTASTPPVSASAASSSSRRTPGKRDDSSQSLFDFLEGEKWEDDGLFWERESPVYFCEDCGDTLVLCYSCGGYFCNGCERRQCNLCHKPPQKRTRPESEKWHSRGFGIVRFVPISIGEDDFDYYEEEWEDDEGEFG